MRDHWDVECEHAFECFGGCRYGKGCWEDDEQSAMGGKPWSECYCMTESERLELAIERHKAQQQVSRTDSERGAT